MDVLGAYNLGLLFCLFCLAALAIVFAFVLLGVWVWMLNDWSKRTQTDPAANERYRIQMIIGWPFGYFLNVYRKQGPAR